MKKTLLTVVLAAAISGSATEQTATATAEKAAQATKTAATKTVKAVKKAAKTTADKVKKATTPAATAKPAPTTAVKAPAAPVAATPVAPATQTVTASEAQATAPAAAKNWDVNLGLDASTGVQDQRENGSEASITSGNALRLRYKIAPNQKVGVAQGFALNKIAAKNENKSKILLTNGLAGADVQLRHDLSGLKLAGSNDFALTSRFYLPTSEYSRAAKSNGRIRFNTEVPYTLTSLMELGVGADTNIRMFASNSQSQLDVNPSVTLYFNVSDAVQPFVSGDVNYTFEDVAQGRNTSQGSTIEAGANLTLAKGVIVIPSMLTEKEILKAGDDRLFSHETSKYRLQTSISF